MKHIKTILAAAALTLGALSYPVTTLAEVSSRDLMLDGANVHKLAASPDGQYVFAACQGPRGLFYSENFGESWQYASGGQYDSGEGQGVVVASSAVFAVAGNTLYKSPLALPLAWERVDITLEEGENQPVNPYSLYLDEHLLIVGTSQGKIVVLDANDLALLEVSELPVQDESQFGRVIHHTAPSRAAGVIVAQSGFWSTGSKIFRASYNPELGTIGAWQEIIMPGSTGAYTGVFIAPNNDLFVTSMSTADSSQNAIYRSTDSGTSFEAIISGDRAHAGFAAFAGDTFVIGKWVSHDSGQSWQELPSMTDKSNINTNAAVIHPSLTDPLSGSYTTALISTDVGVAGTEDLDQGELSSWFESNLGLKGLIVNDVAQLADDRERVIIATKSGAAISLNFRADEPAWNFPLFPSINGGTDGSPILSAVIDPNNRQRFFVGSSRLYQGIIDDSADPTWSLVSSAGDGLREYMRITDLMIWENILVSSHALLENQADGEINFWDISNSPPTLIRNALVGRPVRGAAVVDNSLIFAAVGARDDVPGHELPENYGIYVSTDSGSSWSRVENLPYEAKLYGLVYAAADDYLYAFGERVNEDTQLQDDDQAPPPSLNGAFFRLRNASRFGEGKAHWEEAERGLPYEFAFSGVAIDPDTGDLYLSAGNRIYQSLNNGGLWTLYYSGLENENTSTLFYDPLVHASDANFQELDGDGIPIVADVSYRGGAKMRRKSSVNMRFNVPMAKGPTSKGVRVRVSGGQRVQIKKRWVQRNNVTSLKLVPGTYWPKNARVRLVMRDGSKAADGSALDGNYDQTPGGAFQKTIRVAKR